MNEVSEKSESRDIVEKRDVSGKQELQQNRDVLENKIFYEEHHIQYLQDEINREHSYRKRVRREKRENQAKFFLFGTVVVILLFVVYVLAIMINRLDLSGSAGFVVTAISGVAAVIMPILFAFGVIALVVFGLKFKDFAKQVKGTEDPRLRGGYKTYDEMWQTSEGRMKYLEKELMESVLTQEANKELLTERQLQEARAETEVISMDELFQIKSEEIPTLPEPENNMKTISMDELYEIQEEKKLALPEKEKD